MPRSFIVAIATIYLYFVTAALGLGIPGGSAKNASHISIRAEEDRSEGIDCSGSCTHHRGIPEGLFHTFELMAQYSAAAYCVDNNNSPNTTITCSANNCPLVEAAGARSTAEFADIKTADDTGFFAIDETNRIIVLSFRGSRSRANWQHNWHIKKVQTDLCPRCKVHAGFWEAWVEIRDQIKAQVPQLIKTYPHFRFAITGHSLGGALAILAAGDLRKVNEDLLGRTELYSFGSPRVGGKHAVEFLSMQSRQSYRITNRKDVIPRLPPFFLGYLNTSPEYYIRHHSRNPSPDDFEVIDSYAHGGNSDTGSFIRGWKKHHSYFMKDIAKCSHEVKDRSGHKR